MSTLYEISEAYNKILTNLCDPETGEIDQETLEQLNDIKDSLEDKCINVMRVIKNYEAELMAVKKERLNMQAREKSLEHKCETLKAYLIDHMKKCEVKNVKCPQFSISLRTNPPSVLIKDATRIPDIYKVIKMEEKIDLRDIKAAILAGVKVDGAELTNGYSLNVK